MMLLNADFRFYSLICVHDASVLDLDVGVCSLASTFWFQFPSKCQPFYCLKVVCIVVHRSIQSSLPLPCHGFMFLHRGNQRRRAQ